MQSKKHLIPQVILDIVNGAKKSKSNRFAYDNYVMRLEEVSMYCNRALKELEKHDEKY